MMEVDPWEPPQGGERGAGETAGEAVPVVPWVREKEAEEPAEADPEGPEAGP